jgi:hypothetical protein
MEKAKTCAKKYELVSDQVVYNPLYRAAEPLLETGRRLGFVVIAWSPLAKGAALKETLGHDPARSAGPSAVKRAQTPEGRRVVGDHKEDRRKRRGASPAAVVLAWHAAKGSYPIPGVKERGAGQRCGGGGPARAYGGGGEGDRRGVAPFVCGLSVARRHEAYTWLSTEAGFYISWGLGSTIDVSIV